MGSTSCEVHKLLTGTFAEAETCSPSNARIKLIKHLAAAELNVHNIKQGLLLEGMTTPVNLPLDVACARNISHYVLVMGICTNLNIFGKVQVSQSRWPAQCTAYAQTYKKVENIMKWAASVLDNWNNGLYNPPFQSHCYEYTPTFGY